MTMGGMPNPLPLILSNGYTITANTTLLDFFKQTEAAIIEGRTADAAALLNVYKMLGCGDWARQRRTAWARHLPCTVGSPPLPLASKTGRRRRTDSRCGGSSNVASNAAAGQQQSGRLLFSDFLQAFISDMTLSSAVLNLAISSRVPMLTRACVGSAGQTRPM